MDSRTKSNKKIVPTHEIRPPGSKKHVETLKTTPFFKKIPKLTKIHEVVIFSLFPLEKALFPLERLKLWLRRAQPMHRLTQGLLTVEEALASQLERSKCQRTEFS